MTVDQARMDTDFEVDIKALELLPADEPEWRAEEFPDSCGMGTCAVFTLLRDASRPEFSLK